MMTPAEPKVITLRTGAEVPEPVITPVTLALHALEDSNPIALYEAACMARDRSYVPFGNTGAVLEGIGLLQRGGTMHDATRDVILAAIDGEDLDLRLVSPFAATEVTS